jgi:hypothetical protein
MVNTTSIPRFNLKAMQLAAGLKDGLSITSRARQDAENLGKDFEEVRKIVLGLRPSDFDHVWIKRDEKKRLILNAQGKEIAMDVYSPRIVAPNGEECSVYLKLMLTATAIAITSIQSFHQHRK